MLDAPNTGPSRILNRGITHAIPHVPMSAPSPAYPSPSTVADMLHASEPIAAVRLVIIEDFRSMAEMLRLLCTERWGLDVAATADCGEAGLVAVTQSKPDLILLDIGLPDVDGLTLLPRLRRASPASKIILISSLFNACVLGRLEGLKWDGLLDKIADGIELLREAIQAVRKGERYVSPTARRLIALYQQSDNPFSRMLSDREIEVLVCIAHAQSNEEIAVRLSIDATTVQSHRESLFRKLGQHSTPKLMHYAIRHGYGTLPLPVSG